MNAIILDLEMEAWLTSVASATPPLNANATVGWKTEAERLERGARRREREPRE
jgi:hypothetical protein